MMVDVVVIVGNAAEFWGLRGACCGEIIGAVWMAVGVTGLVAGIDAIVCAGIGAVKGATVSALMGARIGAFGWCGSTEVLRIFSKLRIALLSSMSIFGSGSVGWEFLKVSNRSPKIMVNFLEFVGCGISQSWGKYSTVSDVQNAFVLGTQQITFQ